MTAKLPHRQRGHLGRGTNFVPEVSHFGQVPHIDFSVMTSFKSAWEGEGTSGTDQRSERRLAAGSRAGSQEMRTPGGPEHTNLGHHYVHERAWGHAARSWRVVVTEKVTAKHETNAVGRQPN